MPEYQNVQIPLSLFKKLLFFFECVSIGDYTFPSYYNFDVIQTELRGKQNKVNIRTAYTNTLLAKNEDQKRQAYDNYLRLKNKR
jgi:hypothetical protein